MTILSKKAQNIVLCIASGCVCLVARYLKHPPKKQLLESIVAEKCPECGECFLENGDCGCLDEEILRKFIEEFVAAQERVSNK